MNAFAVTPPYSEELEITRAAECDGVHFIETPVSGWDDVKPHARKLLSFEGRTYGWSCWNSDRMVSVFRSPPFPDSHSRRARVINTKRANQPA
jgi:hypothetical protein